MPILLIGLNHRTAPVELREQYALTGCGTPMALQEIKTQLHRKQPDGARSNLSEVVILSTCNRLEIYAVAANAEIGWQSLQQFLCRLQGVPPEQLAPHLYTMQDCEAVEHLMQVASGLDSMILGEPQILGQVASAFQDAQGVGTAGPMLSQLFAQSLHTGKRARSETAISRYTTSISHAAALLASDKLENLAEANALIIGAGEMAVLAAQAIQRMGTSNITFINRTYTRAQALADEIHAQALNWQHLSDALRKADVVITATGAPHTVIHRDDVVRILSDRTRSPLLFLDIAVPRDIEEAVGDLPGVMLFDIDDLQSAVDANLTQREAAIPDVNQIIAQEIEGFSDWVASRDIVPIINELRRKATEIAALEVTQTLNKLDNLENHDEAMIKRMAHRIVNKLLHEPTIRLKAHAANGDAYDYANVMQDLFALSGGGLSSNGNGHSNGHRNGNDSEREGTDLSSPGTQPGIGAAKPDFTHHPTAARSQH